MEDRQASASFQKYVCSEKGRFCLFLNLIVCMIPGELAFDFFLFLYVGGGRSESD